MSQSNSKIKRPAPDYFEKVAMYYNREALYFEARYQDNSILQRIRSDFRRITDQFFFKSALEIGCGPGLDLIYFTQNYPDIKIYGLDVSAEMLSIAQKNLESVPKNQVQLILGNVEKMPDLLPEVKFDLIYCYYGALNTVKNLNVVAQVLRKTISENGTLVLTFINRWYWFDIFWNLLRGRVRKAFCRINGSWVGYSPERPLSSSCYSAREIKSVFQSQFNIIYKKGYSIIFPAWYRSKFIQTNGRFGQALWQVDQLINKTPLWNAGEYSLYVLKPK